MFKTVNRLQNSNLHLLPLFAIVYKKFIGIGLYGCSINGLQHPLPLVNSLETLLVYKLQIHIYLVSWSSVMHWLYAWCIGGAFNIPGASIIKD